MEGADGRLSDPSDANHPSGLASRPQVPAESHDSGGKFICACVPSFNGVRPTVITYIGTAERLMNSNLQVCAEGVFVSSSNLGFASSIAVARVGPVKMEAINCIRANLLSRWPITRISLDG